eukprot:TRINITY_DN3511_c0_g1_i4.p1 TRINITY_DN3511_c0_g1~~TRINITY_DN3511_c0_g1_i4.p1  ORF type:complete len:219 (+),score=46.22 TRINITY_DN3511_c0_g1_i4:20-676(+)
MRILVALVALLPIFALGQYTLTAQDKTAILAAHNFVRSTYANGGVQGFPKASNMLEIRFDEEAAKLAAARLQNSNSELKHSKLGQCGGSTIRLVSSSKFTQIPWNTILGNCAKQKKNWRSEFSVNKFTSQMVGAVGCFSQFIWAKTEVIGCAVALSTSNGFNQVATSCIYCHAGNYLEASIYDQGEPCSACPGKKSSRKKKNSRTRTSKISSKPIKRY